MVEKLRPYVFLDTDLCSGCNSCSEIAPTVFRPSEFIFSSVVHLDGVEQFETNEPSGLSGRTLQSDEIPQVTAAAEACPGEIIVLEF